MSLSLKEVDAFYKTDLGRYACKQISDQIKKSKEHEITVCSAGSFPFVEKTETTFFQGYETPSFVPQSIEGSLALAERSQWPYRAESVDQIIMAHDFEFAEEREVYLREAWRILKGEGRLMIIIPNRKGKWVRAAHTPFSRGYTCHLGGVIDTLHRTHFKLDRIVPLLFTPPDVPSTSIGRLAYNAINNVGEYCGMQCGVRILEISKHIFAPTRGLKEMVTAPAEKLLMPAKAKLSNKTHSKKL
jgi:SAM-dependent methyltransferase